MQLRPEVDRYYRIRIKIIDIYPGEKYSDICLDYRMPDFEYEEVLRHLDQKPDSSGNLGFRKKGVWS